MVKTSAAAPVATEDRPGMIFQNLVAVIERAISGQEGVTLESPAFVLDADGDRREHDILITHTEGLRVTRTAVECKDHGRKIGKPDLEAFRSKCQDTGIHKGVIVSSSGFAKSALKMSKRTNIQCLELAKADVFTWVGMSVFYTCVRDYSNIDVKVFSPTSIVAPFRVFAPNGEELTIENFKNISQQAINGNAELGSLGRESPVTVQIQWKPADAVYVIDAEEARHEVEHILLEPTFTVTETPQPFELHNYQGDECKLEVATAELNLYGQDVNLVLVRGNENIRFAIQPKPNGEPAG